MNIIQAGILVGLFTLFPFYEAFAYVDPGTGSMIIQVLIGALVAIGVGFRVFWYKIKEKITRSNHK